MRPILLALLAPFLIARADAAAPPEQRRPASRPNVLLLFADDQRADTIGALGNPIIQTPNLDRLARSGIAFRRAYMQGGLQPATCSPSRAMLLSGRPLFRIDENLSRDPTWPAAFGRAGYTTFLSGKWHNNHRFENGRSVAGEMSIPKSFQIGRAIFAGGMTDPLTARLSDMADGALTSPRLAPKHACAMFADAAIAFLKEPRDKPFFCYLPFDAPHDPHIVPDDFPIRYDPDKIPLPPNYLPQHPFDNGEMTIRDELLLPWPRPEEGVRQMIAEYYRYISYLDAEIGRVLDALRASPHARNTIVIFAADSGVARGAHGLIGKQNLYEHSMRVPLILSGPGIPEGRSTDAMCYLYDLLPTVGALCGVTPPATSEGIDLTPTLRDPTRPARDSLMFAYRDVQRAYRDGRWKLIRYPKIDRTQLFDLQTDPDERIDLAARPDLAPRIEAMTASLKEMQRQLGDPAPLAVDHPLPAAWTPPPAKPAPRPKPAADKAPVRRPNILFAISDDQSFAHTSIAGYPGVKTPGFDRVAREGVLFRNAFAPAPGCSPTRAAFLTGRHIWQIEQAGTHASGFSPKYVTYPDLLERDGYFVGMTGKGWAPGNYKIDGRTRNPAGPEFNRRTLDPPRRGINRNDYAANFADFLEARPADKPFCFWYGATEPHRGFEKGAGINAGKRLEDAPPPPFLPDTPEVRSDILDYCTEIEWFDSHLRRMLALLEQKGELDRTLVIVTSDNGMAFPRAKANLYEYGFHMPLAIRWGARVPGGRVIEDPVGFVDLTATILEAAGVTHPSRQYPPAGRSILPALTSNASGVVDPSREAIFAGRERHSSSRYDNWTYPQRAIRTRQFLYIRNFRPERWPAGDPVVLETVDGKTRPAGPHSGYKDIDPSPTLEFLVANVDDPKLRPYLDLAVARRPAEELFDIRNDPGCLKDLAGDPKFAEIRRTLAGRLETTLRQTGDPRVIDGGEIWESYPRYSPIRAFPPPDRQ